MLGFPHVLVKLLTFSPLELLSSIDNYLFFGGLVDIISVAVGRQIGPGTPFSLQSFAFSTALPTLGFSFLALP